MLEKYSLLAWIIKNNLKTEDGRPFRLDDSLFLFDILRDLASLDKDIVAMKAAQIRFSTAATIASLWCADNKGVNVIYTLPTQADVFQFVGGKVNRLISQNPCLLDMVKDKDTVEQKQVGNNIIYYRGTFTQKSAMMVSSDLNVHDELDTSDQNVVENYSTRLQASKVKRTWWFSHPSLPNYGIHEIFKKSDQKHWFITSPHCKKKQYLSWPESICEKREIYQCKHCFKELSDEDRCKGIWVQKFKNRDISGYVIPLLICPWVSAKEIIKYHNEKSAEYFYTKVLGLPYESEGTKISRTALLQSITGEYRGAKGQVVIGVDTGKNLHIVVGDQDGIFYNEEADDYDAVEKLLRRFPRSIAVIDQGGDIISPRKLREKYPGRVFLCTYRRDRKGMQLVIWGQNKELGSVIADRNRVIQLVADETGDGRLDIAGVHDDWKMFIEHCLNIHRTEEENALGQKEYVWVRTGPDHFLHALCYWRIGMTRNLTGQAAIIGAKPTLQVSPGITVDPVTQRADPRGLEQVRKWTKKD
jgi:hypothetical protein